MEYQLKNFKKEFNITRLANIHYFEFTSDYVTKPDSHNFNEIVYVDSGEIDVVSESYTGKLKKNQMIIHPHNQLHHLLCNNDVAPNVIIIGFECKDYLFTPLAEKPLVLNENLKKMLADIIKEGRNIFQPPYDIPNLKNMPKRKNFEFGADQLIKNLLESFLIFAIREYGKQIEKSIAPISSSDSYIFPIKEYINNNFTKNINLSDLCFLFGTNKTTLCKEFKKHTGLTIVDYINSLRVKHTKSLLRENHYSLTQIADMLNLSSVHYLTTLFKKYEKLTPTEYLSTIKSKYE